MASDPQAAFKELTKRAGKLLKLHKFKGSGQNFTRDCGEIWQGLNFQRTQWRLHADEPINFTINLGLYFNNQVTPALEWRKAKTDIRQYRPSHSDFSLRVGDILARKLDTWWNVDHDLLEVVSDEIINVLECRVIPLFALLSTRDGACLVMQNRPWLINNVTRDWMGKQAPPPWETDSALYEELKDNLLEILERYGAKHVIVRHNGM